jgi:hypothetical protein
VYHIPKLQYTRAFLVYGMNLIGNALMYNTLNSQYIVGEVDFFYFFFIFNFLQFAVDGKNNSKTKVQKVFFFIFMSSYAEMSFLN